MQCSPLTGYDAVETTDALGIPYTQQLVKRPAERSTNAAVDLMEQRTASRPQRLGLPQVETADELH